MGLVPSTPLYTSRFLMPASHGVGSIPLLGTDKKGVFRPHGLHLGSLNRRSFLQFIRTSCRMFRAQDLKCGPIHGVRYRDSPEVIVACIQYLFFS